MAVLSTFREPSLCRHVHRELLRSVLLDVTPIIAATACHQRNYVERYSRYKSNNEITVIIVPKLREPQDTLVGIELMHMIKKRQLRVEAGAEGLTAAELFY